MKVGGESCRRYNTRIPIMPQGPTSRRETLEKFLAANPKDAFARYGLALECAKTGDAGAATSHFQSLVADHPDYVTGYFQFGQFLARLGRIEEARNALTQGIAAAVRTGDSHAQEEMQAAKDAL
jgi:Flp pilus assembly protein TadD